MKIRFVSAISAQFDLGWILARRQVASRYKGSAVGVTWSVIQPLIMLSIYTFVFSTIFKSRWLGQEEAGSLGYALNLFTGLVLFNVVAEVMGSSTSLITSNKNYVTKIIFPSLYAAGKPSILSINKCSTVNINTDDILLHSKWIFVGILAMDDCNYGSTATNIFNNILDNIKPISLFT